MATTTDLAQALRYGPQTAGLVRRSAYLEDALRALQTEGGQNIRSPAELAAKLVATALLSRASNKAQDATLTAVDAQRKDRVARMLAGISEPEPQAEAPPPQSLPPAQAVQPAPAPAPQPVQTAPLPPASSPTAMQASPQDREALIRMLATEAIGEGPQGMAAAGHVAMNRARTGFMGAKSLSDVVNAPHQFTGMSRAGQIRPQDYQAASQVADAILSGQIPDPTGGAVNFINPELQTQNGDPMPAWAQGQGQRIGRHVFFGGHGAQQQVAQAAPQPPMPPDPQAGPEQAAMPFQVAANGPLQPGMVPTEPSAPAVSPGGAGAPPAAPPQAAAGGRPSDPWAARKVLVRRLMSSADPEEQAHGEAEYWKLMGDMAQPTKWDIKVQDGYLIATDPNNPDNRHVQKLDELQTHDAPPPAGLPAGTVGQRNAKGDYNTIYTPPAGYQGGPGGQAPIKNGPADPAAGMNLVNNEGKLRDDYEAQVKPYIAAREGYKKVVQAAGDMTPAGSIALVFGYMKTLDPGSTVREGEQASVQNSGTIPQTIQNMYNKLLAGTGTLTADQRAQFANSARGQFEVYQNTFDAANERFGELAKGYHFDPNRVIRHFDPIAPYNPPPHYSDAVNLKHQQMVQAGQYDQNAPLGDAKRPFLARTQAEAAALDKPENRGKFVILPDGSTARVK